MALFLKFWFLYRVQDWNLFYIHLHLKPIVYYIIYNLFIIYVCLNFISKDFK